MINWPLIGSFYDKTERRRSDDLLQKGIERELHRIEKDPPTINLINAEGHFAEPNTYEIISFFLFWNVPQAFIPIEDYDMSLAITQTGTIGKITTTNRVRHLSPG